MSGNLHTQNLNPFERLGRVDIYVKLSVIVGARFPRPSPNVDRETPTIQVKSIVGRDSYLDKISSISRNNPSFIEPNYCTVFVGGVDFGKSTYRFRNRP